MKELFLNPAFLFTASLFMAIAIYSLFLLYKNSSLKSKARNEEKLADEEDPELRDIKLPTIQGIIYPSDKKVSDRNLQR